LLLSVDAIVTDSIRCSYDNLASIRVTVADSSTAYAYTIDGSPSQSSPIFTGVTAGIHYVEVYAANACPGYDTISITKPAPITLVPIITNATCQKNNGAIQLQVSGGAPPYRYAWNNTAQTQNINSLLPGNYTVEVRDAKNCVFNSTAFVVGNQDVPALPNLGRDTVLCNGQQLILNPGPFSNYMWQDLSGSSTYTVTQEGSYSVTVENAAGCKGKDSITISTDCTEPTFPSAFTPDGNGNNETFGILGSTLLIYSYHLRVFNRYGQVVFVTRNPLQKWDGRNYGKAADTGVYIWLVEYVDKNLRPVKRKGTVVLLR
jgi:gliding motility-associated-like protein